MIKVSKTVRDGSIRITFALPAAEPAGAVSVVGDFNNWDPFAHPLLQAVQRHPEHGGDRCRRQHAALPVPADGGHWFDDEAAHAVDAQGATISL